MTRENINDEGLLEYSDEKIDWRDIKLYPLKISFGKIPSTYWVEPVFKTKQNVDWFYDVFVPKVRELVEQTGAYLHHNQRNPSYSSVGWYLPKEVITYLVEIFSKMEVGFIWDVLRPLSNYDYKFKDKDEEEEG